MTGTDFRASAADGVGRCFVLMEKGAAYLYALNGWRRFAAAFGAGLLSVAAHPPVYMLAMLLVTLPAIVWLLDGVGEPSRQNWRSARAAAAVGWWFGFGHFFAGLY